jgi:hypothetical protein
VNFQSPPTSENDTSINNEASENGSRERALALNGLIKKIAQVIASTMTILSALSLLFCIFLSSPFQGLVFPVMFRTDPRSMFLVRLRLALARSLETSCTCHAEQAAPDQKKSSRFGYRVRSSTPIIGYYSGRNTFVRGSPGVP